MGTLLNANVKAMRTNPVEDTHKTMGEPRTTQIRLSKDEAARLGSLLLAAAQEWEEVEASGYRS